METNFLYKNIKEKKNNMCVHSKIINPRTSTEKKVENITKCWVMYTRQKKKLLASLEAFYKHS